MLALVLWLTDARVAVSALLLVFPFWLQDSFHHSKQEERKKSRTRNESPYQPLKHLSIYVISHWPRTLLHDNRRFSFFMCTFCILFKKVFPFLKA